MASLAKLVANQPVVLVPVTPFGHMVAGECQQRFGGKRLDTPWLATVPSSDRLSIAFGEALTSVLGVGHALESFPDDGGCQLYRPQIWLLAAAAELDRNPHSLRHALQAIRDELKRSHMPADLLMLVYTGPILGRPPQTEFTPNQVEALEYDALLLVSDGSARGFRLTFEQAVTASSLQIELLIQHECLLRRILETAADSSNRALSLGAARLGVSPRALETEIQARLRKRLNERLRAEIPGYTLGAGASAAPFSADTMTSILRSADGSLNAAVCSLNHSLEMQSIAARDRRMKSLRDQTGASLRELVPRPIPYRSWWRRFWDWMLGRNPTPAVSPPPVAIRSVDTPSADKAQMLRFRMLQLLAETDKKSPTDGGSAPWEISLLEPSARMEIGDFQPSLENLVWQALSRAAEQMDRSGAPGDFSRSLDEMCRRVVAGSDLSAWFHDARAGDLVRKGAAICSPLFPGGHGAMQRLALAPGHLGESWRQGIEEQGFELAESSGDLVLFSVASNLDFTIAVGDEHDADRTVSLETA